MSKKNVAIFLLASVRVPFLYFLLAIWKGHFIQL